MWNPLRQRHEIFTNKNMNNPSQLNYNHAKFFLPPPKKESLAKAKKAPIENKKRRSVYPEVRMPEQPDGFLKAKRHTLF